MSSSFPPHPTEAVPPECKSSTHESRAHASHVLFYENCAIPPSHCPLNTMLAPVGILFQHFDMLIRVDHCRASSPVVRGGYGAVGRLKQEMARHEMARPGPTGRLTQGQTMALTYTAAATEIPAPYIRRRPRCSQPARPGNTSLAVQPCTATTDALRQIGGKGSVWRTPIAVLGRPRRRGRSLA